MGWDIQLGQCKEINSPRKCVHKSQRLFLVLTKQVEYVFQPIQICAIGFIKLSFIFFYCRMFVAGSFRNNVFGKVMVTVIVLVVSWMVAISGTFFFNCGKHISAQWNGTAELRAECDNTLMSENALAISDCITNIIVFLLPIPIMRNHSPATNEVRFCDCK